MTRIASALFIILFANSFAFGQQSPLRSTVEGTVTESNHLPIAGASVQLIDPSTNENRTATTDGTGTFRMTGLRVGIYELHANAPGFSTYTQIGIVLTVDQTVRLNIDLVPAQVKSQITVTAAPSPLDVAQTSVTSVIGHEQIEELPV